MHLVCSFITRHSISIAILFSSDQFGKLMKVWYGKLILPKDRIIDLYLWLIKNDDVINKSKNKWNQRFIIRSHVCYLYNRRNISIMWLFTWPYIIKLMVVYIGTKFFLSETMICFIFSVNIAILYLNILLAFHFLNSRSKRKQ